MTLDIFVGRVNKYIVSNATRGIFRLVATELEDGSAGSRFPLLFELSKSDVIIPYKKIGALIEELYTVRKELTAVPYPVAACYSGKMEVDYFAMIQPDGIFSSWQEDGPEGKIHYDSGIDHSGLFISKSSLFLFRPETTLRTYYKHRSKGQKYFEEVLPLIPYRDMADIDRVEHAWKSSGRVWNVTLESLQSLCYLAKERKKYICQR